MNDPLRKAKTARGKRAIEAREPKLVEVVKNIMLLRGTSSNSTTTAILHDLYMLSKPNAVNLHKPVQKRPFEDETSIEFLGQKNDCGLFVYASHSKKRPNNLIMGRLFDYHLLDMIELGVEHLKPMASFKTVKSVVGSKPCLMFEGEGFSEEPQLMRLKNLLLDFFRGPQVTSVNVAGLDHLISFVALPTGRVEMRTYSFVFLKSGSKLPRVELEEMGPSMDLLVRRERLPDDDVLRESLRQPKAAQRGKRKNVEHFAAAGQELGRIHMEKQDLDQVALRRVRAHTSAAATRAKEQGKDSAPATKRQRTVTAESEDVARS